MHAQLLDREIPAVREPQPPPAPTEQPVVAPLRPPRWRKAGRVLLVLVGLGFVLYAVYSVILRPWHRTWGATDPELVIQLPGDQLVPNPVQDMQTTRAITINAPAATIWPWLLQMGQGRGGFYSYDWFENLIGCDIHSADRVHPEWQNVVPGDQVRMYPPGGGPPPYIVAQILPGRGLVLGHHPLDAAGTAGPGWHDTWAFVLIPIDAQHTRLVVRTRAADDLLVFRVIEPGVFIMERGMLLGIRDRAQ